MSDTEEVFGKGSVLDSSAKSSGQPGCGETALLTIRNLCDAPHWTSARRWKIRDLAAAALSKEPIHPRPNENVAALLYDMFQTDTEAAPWPELTAEHRHIWLLRSASLAGAFSPPAASVPVDRL